MRQGKAADRSRFQGSVRSHPLSDCAGKGRDRRAIQSIIRAARPDGGTTREDCCVGSLLAVSMATYAGTALDNLLMLTVLRAAGVQPRSIASGFLIGNAIVLAICAAGTGLALMLPPHYLGYLGIAPVGLGVVGLVNAFRSGTGASTSHGRSDTGGIATLQVASSFDSIAAFLPLFADTDRPYGLVIAAGFAAMALLWLVASRFLASIRGVTAALRPIERFARPVVLILVGLFVLANTRLDVEPDMGETPARYAPEPQPGD
jgi:cadmium resistance protein CadD (predicted permease)